MNVYFVPNYSDENLYLTNVQAGLKFNRVNVLSEKRIPKSLVPLDSIVQSVFHKNLVVHFNWIENKISNSLRGKTYFSIVRLWVFLLKVLNVKICWTMHNKIPHTNGSEDTVRQFFHFFVQSCDLIVVHNSESKNLLFEEYDYEKQVCFIPHGSYKGPKQPALLSRKQAQTYLFFGMVSRYKNVPLLIKVFKQLSTSYPEIELRIMGKCKDPILDAEIRDDVRDNERIYYQNAFLTEDELDSEIDQTAAVVLPYDKESMLNSGSAIKAFSRGRSVIIPEFGYINDIKNRDFVFSYNYTENVDHEDKLKSAWLSVIKSESEDPAYLYRIGNDAFNFANNDLNWKNITATLKKSYADILAK